MYKYFVLKVILLFAISTGIFAQVTGFKDDFEDGNINGWIADHERTFQLSNENGSLKINYTRTAESDQWDNFNFTPPQTIDITSKPIITFKIKSNVNTAFSIKPTNGNDVPLITKDVTGDGEWREMTFDVVNVNSKTINKIYFYFDGGSTSPAQGEVYFDEIAFGDSAKYVLNYNELDKAISAAQKLLENTIEGQEEGQHEPGSGALLQLAIDKAIEFKASQSEDINELDNAIWDLYDACVDYETSVYAVEIDLVDDNTTKETRYLFLSLDEIAERSLIFGMHDVTGYGVGWRDDNDRSDVYDVVGDYPAMFSEDLSKVQNNNDIEGMKYRLSTAYNRGAIITICWHQYDPMGRGFYDDDVNFEKIVPTILAGGNNHQYYKDLLRRVALFFKSLRGENGESIPVIFRPYHEHTGSWFWWGEGHRTTAEYNQIWRFTVEYLRDSLNVHNLLYALSPSLEHVRENEEYLATYPGDEYVDIFGTDKYFSRNPVSETEKHEFLTGLQTIIGLAKRRDKLTALTEVGNENLEIPNWFSNILLNPLKNDETARNVSYAAVWRNSTTTHHFAPYPGHSSVPDFMNFYNDPYTIFESDLPSMYTLPTDDLEPPLFLTDFDTAVVFTTTEFMIEIDTDERAFLKYGYSNNSFDNLPFEFSSGQGSYRHSVIIESEQGAAGNLYVHAKDDVGNVTADPLIISFVVDTMQAPVVWNDLMYPDESWITGATPIGTDIDNPTITENVRTVYFRKDFELTDVPGGLALQIRCKGGTAFYINGSEILRINMPDGQDLLYDTDPTGFTQITQTITLSSEYLALLKEGINVIASEVHAPSGETVGNFDLRMFDDTYTALIDYGAEWNYYDTGNRPSDVTVADITGIESFAADQPADYKLYTNYPNPFNPSTTIRFDINKESKVTIKVYDILGRLVETIVNDNRIPGTYEVVFNANSLASGMYSFVLQAGDFVQTRKMLLLK